MNKEITLTTENIFKVLSDAKKALLAKPKTECCAYCLGDIYPGVSLYTNYTFCGRYGFTYILIDIEHEFEDYEGVQWLLDRIAEV